MVNWLSVSVYDVDAPKNVLTSCFEMVEFVQAVTDVELLVTVPFALNINVVLATQLFSNPFNGVTSSEKGIPPNT
jgi:hypothetical protein